MSLQFFGNKSIFRLPKTAFFCSRAFSPASVLKCYDWAIDQREKGNCVISGFHSDIEKDVFHYLLAGKQPIVWVLARSMIKKLPKKLIKAVEEERLLIVSIFDEKIKRASKKTTDERNLFVMQSAEKICVGHASQGGSLQSLIEEFKAKIDYL